MQCGFINLGIKSWFCLQQPLKILVWWSISLKNDDILFFPVTTSNLKRDNVSCTIVTLRMEHYQNVKSLYSRMAVENTCLQCDKSLGSPSNADIAVLTIGRTFNIFFFYLTRELTIFFFQSNPLFLKKNIFLYQSLIWWLVLEQCGRISRFLPLWCLSIHIPVWNQHGPEYIYQEIERCDLVIQLTIVKQCKPFSKNRKAFTTNLSMSFKEVFGERENAKKFTTVMNREGRGRSL